MFTIHTKKIDLSEVLFPDLNSCTLYDTVRYYQRWYIHENNADKLYRRLIPSKKGCILFCRIVCVYSLSVIDKWYLGNPATCYYPWWSRYCKVYIESTEPYNSVYNRRGSSMPYHDDISAFKFPSPRITLYKEECKIVPSITQYCVPFHSKYQVPAASLHNQVSLKIS